MDKLEVMFRIQNNLQKKLGIWDKIKNKVDHQAYVNQMFLACFEEVVEIMKETGYKNPSYSKFGWKKKQEWDKEKFKEEIIDLWHFIMNLSLSVGMEADEFFKIYCKKNNINHERQENDY